MGYRLLLETPYIEEAVKAEPSLPSGLIEARFYTTAPLGREKLQDTFDTLYSNGVDVREVSEAKSNGLWYVAVRYHRPAASSAISALPVAIIPLIAFGMIALLVGVGIFKIEDIVNNVGKLVLLVGGVMIVVAALARGPAMAYVQR